MEWKLYPAAELIAYQERWQSLNRGRRASPLLDLAFLKPALNLFGTGNEVLGIYGGETPRAMTILNPIGRGKWETFQPSQAPIGAWVHDEGLPLDRLLAGLLKKLPGFPVVLGITQQDPDLVSRPVDQGCLRTLDYIDTARISITGTFEEYWQGRGKNLRHNMKKQRNNLDKLGIATRLEVIVAPEDVASAISEYGRMESAGWKAQSGTAVHPDNAQGRFYRAMLEEFCRRGTGRIYRYWYNDDVAAMDLCIEGNGAIIILKTTYDESVSNGTSPAFLMRQESFKQLFDEGRLERIEFYGKLMDWHTKWSEEVRTMYHINCYRWPIIPMLRGGK